MKISRRVRQCALVAWALYLVLALSTFALHIHAPFEAGHGAHCALCLAQNVASAVSVVAVCVLVAPALCWKLQLWPSKIEIPVIAAVSRVYEARGPPVLFY